jgi:hypothetical protein
MLLAVAIVLCVGWIVAGALLGQQVRRQSALAKRIEEIERSERTR